MSVEIKEVITRKDIRQFVDFQFELYKDSEYWVPPLKADEVKSLLPGHNPAFGFCKSKFWLAYKDNKCVGRIGGIINEKYIEKINEKIARFSRIEFVDDFEVSAKLLETAEKWAKEQGMTAIHGPLGFTNLDHQAILIEGFDYLPSVASEYHFPYYKEHLEKAGYEKEIDWIEFRLTMPKEIPEKAIKLCETIKKRYNLTAKSFLSTKDLLIYASDMFELLNKAFAELFSVVAFDEKMVQYYKKKYMKMLNPKFVKIVFDADYKVVGFIIGVPSLSKAMQKAKGKLFPFGIFYIMKALKNPKEIDLFLTAVDPQLQGMGLPSILISEQMQTILENGITHVETTGMIETNQKAIQHWKNYEHVQHKRKRCFKKSIQ
ncbi:MAG: N-acetyltransferase [Bacteroidales bacterium]|nr:N-acetyltransferase [Bacteroidales bacterium]